MRLTLSCLALLTLCLPLQTVLADRVDTIYLNGRIYTANDQQPWVEALAVTDQRFAAVGTNDEIRALANTDTREVNLDGRMVIPGIHDAHSHMLWGGYNTYFACNLKPGSNLEAIIQTLRGCEAKLETGAWLVAGSAWSEQFPGKRFHRSQLDAAFPERPVFIFEGSQHHAFLNTRGLKSAEIDATTRAPFGGRIVRDEQGRLTGELVETATYLASRNFPATQAAHDVEALARTSELFSRHGITSTQESSANARVLSTFKTVDEQGKLQQRVAAHIIWESPQFADSTVAEMEALIERRSEYRSTHLETDYVKMWIDGSPTPPYFTEGNINLETDEIIATNILIPPGRLNRFVTQLDAEGVKVKMHVAGTGAARVALDAVAAARKANGDSGVIHELGHSNLVMEKDVARMKDLRVAGDMSPSIWHLYPTTMGNPPFPAWPFRTMHEHGVLMTIGTDWPVTDDPNVFPAVQGLLDRGYESLDLDTALKMLTINGAVSMGWQAEQGSIETGKLANFVVLSQLLFEVPASQVGETEVLRTVFEGTTVYLKNKP